MGKTEDLKLWAKKYWNNNIRSTIYQIIMAIMTLIMIILSCVMVKLTCSTDELSNRILEERHTVTFYIDDTVYVARKEWIINLKNVGPSSAFDVNIEFPEYNSLGDYLFRHIGIGESKRFEVFKWFKNEKAIIDSIINKQKKIINVKVVYFTKFGDKKRKNFTIFHHTPYLPNRQ